MYQITIIAGNLGRDPEMRFLPSGASVTNFSVATNRQYTDKQGNQIKETEWFNVATWGRLGEICNQYLVKGSKVLVEGRVHAEAWIDKNDGKARGKLVLTATTVKFLNSKGDITGAATADDADMTAAAVNQQAVADPDDGPPF